LRSAARPGPGPAGVRGLGCGDRDDPRRRPRRRGRRGPGAGDAGQGRPAGAGPHRQGDRDEAGRRRPEGQPDRRLEVFCRTWSERSRSEQAGRRGPVPDSPLGPVLRLAPV